MSCRITNIIWADNSYYVHAEESLFIVRLSNWRTIVGYRGWWLKSLAYCLVMRTNITFVSMKKSSA
jgi:hypothetical protein